MMKFSCLNEHPLRVLIQECNGIHYCKEIADYEKWNLNHFFKLNSNTDWQLSFNDQQMIIQNEFITVKYLRIQYGYLQFDYDVEIIDRRIKESTLET